MPPWINASRPGKAGSRASAPSARRSPASRSFVLVVGWVAASLCASGAHAEEDEQSLSVGLGVARIAVDPASGQTGEQTGLGGFLQLDYEYDLSDSFALRGALAGGPLSGPDGLALGGTASVGLTYMFDILRYVPRLTLAGGVRVVDGGGLPGKIVPHVELAAELDILQARSYSWGPFVHISYFGLGEGSFMSLGARATYRWGYF